MTDRLAGGAADWQSWITGLQGAEHPETSSAAGVLTKSGEQRGAHMLDLASRPMNVSFRELAGPLSTWSYEAPPCVCVAICHAGLKAAGTSCPLLVELLRLQKASCQSTLSESLRATRMRAL